MKANTSPPHTTPACPLSQAVFYGEFLFNAEGEDVVAGVRDPQPVAKLQETMPEVPRHRHPSPATSH
jgi:hypothetical protein